MEPTLTSNSMSSPCGVAGAAMIRVSPAACANASPFPREAGNIAAPPAAATVSRNCRRLGPSVTRANRSDIDDPHAHGAVVELLSVWSDQNRVNSIQPPYWSGRQRQKNEQKPPKS